MMKDRRNIRFVCVASMGIGVVLLSGCPMILSRAAVNMQAEDATADRTFAPSKARALVFGRLNQRCLSGNLADARILVRQRFGGRSADCSEKMPCTRDTTFQAPIDSDDWFAMVLPPADYDMVSVRRGSQALTLGERHLVFTARPASATYVGSVDIQCSPEVQRNGTGDDAVEIHRAEGVRCADDFKAAEQAFRGRFPAAGSLVDGATGASPCTSETPQTPRTPEH